MYTLLIAKTLKVSPFNELSFGIYILITTNCQFVVLQLFVFFSTIMENVKDVFKFL